MQQNLICRHLWVTFDDKFTFDNFVSQKCPGGGGGGITPNLGRYVPRQSKKINKRQGLRNELPVECENEGLRNEFEPFWAWKWGAPERARAVLSVKILLSGTARTRMALALWPAANPRRCRTLRVRKMIVSGTAKFAKKNVKWWCSGMDFGEICESYMLRNGNLGPTRAENGGLSRGTYPICIIIYGSTPPPPRAKMSLCIIWIDVQNR